MIENASTLRDSRYEARARDAANPCFICGRHVRVARSTWWVHYTGMDQIILPAAPLEAHHGDEMGWWPVGPECAKLGVIPREFLTHETRPT